MRKVIRAALAGGAERVAVVCGAWHAPALVPEAFPSAAADNARLRGPAQAQGGGHVGAVDFGAARPALRLRRRRRRSRLVPAPGHRARRAHRPGSWCKAARLLRERGHDVSPAGTVEAVRLAEGLAALRGRPGPGLGEVLDAAEASLAGGSPVPLRLIASELLVGHDLGSVPDDTPMVPLARDLAAAQRRLRFRAEAAAKTRRARPAQRHAPAALPAAAPPRHPRHRLGQPADTGRTRGTFKEAWVLQWHPAFEVALVEASAAGTTIEVGRRRHPHRRRRAGRPIPGDIAELVEEALLAELPAALNAAHRHAGRAGGAAARHRPAHGGGGAAGPHPPLRQRPPGRHRGRRPRPGRAPHPGRGRPAGGGGRHRRRRRGRAPRARRLGRPGRRPPRLGDSTRP